MKLKALLSMALVGLYSAAVIPHAVAAEKVQKPATTMTEITKHDFKTFAVNENVKLYRVSFSNQYGMEIVGNLFMPKDLKGKASALSLDTPWEQ